MKLAHSKVSGQTARAWLTIWTEPRKTIRQIVNSNPEYWVAPLAILSGIARALDQASKQGLGDKMVLSDVLIVALVGGFLGGVAFLYIGGILFQWTGSWLGGRATCKEVRCAIAWSSIPDAAILIIILASTVVFGRNWFTSSGGWIGREAGILLLIFYGGAGLVLLIWRAYLFIQCLAEVHQFSAWKGLGAFILAALVVVIPLLALMLIPKILAG